MNDRPKVDISPDFTIDDIHKIRKANYEFTKNMTVEEKLAYYNDTGKRVHEEIQRLRAARLAETEQKKHTA